MYTCTLRTRIRNERRYIISIRPPEPQLRFISTSNSAGVGDLTMQQLIFTVFAVIAACDGFTNVYPKLRSLPIPEKEDVGDPLFLTPLIESGKIDLARQKALVQHKEMTDVSSYAGYLTVNKKYNSNLFFWFFPAQVYRILTFNCIEFWEFEILCCWNLKG